MLMIAHESVLERRFFNIMHEYVVENSGGGNIIWESQQRLEAEIIPSGVPSQLFSS